MGPSTRWASPRTPRSCPSFPRAELPTSGKCPGGYHIPGPSQAKNYQILRARETLTRLDCGETQPKTCGKTLPVVCDRPGSRPARLAPPRTFSEPGPRNGPARQPSWQRGGVRSYQLVPIWCQRIAEIQVHEGNGPNGGAVKWRGVHRQSLQANPWLARRCPHQEPLGAPPSACPGWPTAGFRQLPSPRGRL